MQMTIQVPIWLISLIVPLFISILIVGVTSIVKATKETTKVCTVVDEINKRLDRIETKLDNHISKNN
jgi:uncharacterized membrane-anchored protein YhcB (DUF1043 family)